MKELGFEVTENLCSIKTAFCGTYGSGHPIIGILGEFDALSGLSQNAGCATPNPVVPGGSGHGCGHNLLGAGSLAAAAAVKNYLEETGKPGTIIFYGCPGEEGGAGKAYMAREGLWKKLDAALCWHPGSANLTSTGTNNSCIQVLYKFTGIAAHAASDPYNGRSALDAVELMNVGVQFLREHTTPDCRIHYAITDSGGISPNVVQANASVLYMVRANKVKDSVALQKRVDDIAKGAALMTGTTFERIFIDGTAELVPNFTIEKALYANLSAVGVPHYDEQDIAFASALKATYGGDTLQGFKAAGADAKYMELIQQLTENGHFGMLELLSRDMETGLEIPNLVKSNRVDGLILLGEPEKAYYRMIARQSLPVLFLDFYDEQASAEAVVGDNAYGCYRLTSHLIRNGHTSIGFVGSYRATSSIMDRFLGYSRALLSNDLPVREDWVLPDRDEKGQLLKEIPLPAQMPTAFVCNCDLVAVHLIRTLRAKGLRVPEDISITGFDDFVTGAGAEPELSTFRIDTDAMIDLAVRTIAAKCRGQHKPFGRTVIGGQPVYRNSDRNINGTEE